MYCIWDLGKAIAQALALAVLIFIAIGLATSPLHPQLPPNTPLLAPGVTNPVVAAISQNGEYVLYVGNNVTPYGQARMSTDDEIALLKADIKVVVAICQRNPESGQFEIRDITTATSSISDAWISNDGEYLALHVSGAVEYGSIGDMESGYADGYLPFGVQNFRAFQRNEVTWMLYHTNVEGVCMRAFHNQKLTYSARYEDDPPLDLDMMPDGESVVVTYKKHIRLFSTNKGLVERATIPCDPAESVQIGISNSGERIVRFVGTGNEINLVAYEERKSGWEEVRHRTYPSREAVDNTSAVDDFADACAIGLTNGNYAFSLFEQQAAPYLTLYNQREKILAARFIPYDGHTESTFHLLVATPSGVHQTKVP